MRRRETITLSLAATLSGTVGPTAAQTPVRRLGWLMIQGRGDVPGWLDAFRDELSRLGVVDGHAYVILERYAAGDVSMLVGLAEELVKDGVAVIVATSQPATEAACRATKSVPIVGRMTDDPVRAGLAQSLARPGGNLTGVYSQLDETNPKRLELLQLAVPGLKKVGALLTLSRGASERWRAEAEIAAGQLGLELQVMDVHSSDDLDGVFASAVEAGIGGILAFRNPTIVTYRRHVIELADRYRLPAIFDSRGYADAGALMSYGPNLGTIFRRMAYSVDHIRKGTAPGELPIEQPTTFELVINLKAAKALGVTLAPTLLARADEVIE